MIENHKGFQTLEVQRLTDQINTTYAKASQAETGYTTLSRTLDELKSSISQWKASQDTKYDSLIDEVTRYVQNTVNQAALGGPQPLPPQQPDPGSGIGLLGVQNNIQAISTRVQNIEGSIGNPIDNRKSIYDHISEIRNHLANHAAPPAAAAAAPGGDGQFASAWQSNLNQQFQTMTADLVNLRTSITNDVARINTRMDSDLQNTNANITTANNALATITANISQLTAKTTSTDARIDAAIATLRGETAAGRQALSAEMDAKIKAAVVEERASTDRNLAAFTGIYTEKLDKVDPKRIKGAVKNLLLGDERFISEVKEISKMSVEDIKRIMDMTEDNIIRKIKEGDPTFPETVARKLIANRPFNENIKEIAQSVIPPPPPQPPAAAAPPPPQPQPQPPAGTTVEGMLQDQAFIDGTRTTVRQLFDRSDFCAAITKAILATMRQNPDPTIDPAMFRQFQDEAMTYDPTTVPAAGAPPPPAAAEEAMAA